MSSEANTEEVMEVSGELLTNVGQMRLKEAFRFNGRECWTNKEVWEVLAGRWENAKQLLFEDALKEFYAGQDYGVASEIDWIVKNYRTPKKTEDYTPSMKDKMILNDVGLARFLLLLCDGETLAWRGAKYNSFGEFSKAIADYFAGAEVMATTADFTDLLASEVPEYWHMVQCGGAQPEDPTLAGDIRNIRRLANAESQWIKLIAYTAAIFRFMEDKNQLRYRKCATVDELCEYLAGVEDNFYGEVEKILASPYFYGFLYAIGYSESAKEMIQSIKDGKSAEDLEMLFDFLEINCENPAAKEKLVDCYLKKGPWAHLYWWKTNLNLYEYHNNEAGILRARLEGMKLDASSLEKVREQMEELQGYSVEFRKLFVDNIFLAKMGLNRGRDAITSTRMEAYWHYVFYGKEAPIGFAAVAERGVIK